MADIFISYSKSDRQFTRRLYRELERFKVHGFMDTSDLSSGSEWSAQLRETVRNSDAVVVILSKSATHSSSVMAEIGLADTFRKRVIPILAPGEKYEEAVPPLLLDKVVIDANRLELEEVAARVVAAATDAPLELALNQVRSRALRRQRQLISIIGTLLMLVASLAATIFFATEQRKEAARLQMQALLARAEAENERKIIEQLTGQSGALAVAPIVMEPLLRQVARMVE
jgi:hypothetical protein